MLSLNPYRLKYVRQDGKDYDISDALIITEYDAGLTTKDDAEIDGVVWEDKNYNGKQDKYTDDDGNEVDEPGIENIELQLVPYVYYNNKWQKLKDADLKASLVNTQLQLIQMQMVHTSLLM